MALWWTADWQDWLSSKLKVDLIDRYDRNPTSEDREWDIDEAWLRFGQETEPGDLPEHPWNAYLKVGKFAKFDRQDDRHLESYGVVSTAFSVFEDVGLELGIDFGRRFYLQTSFTSGNPVFFRDPGALVVAATRAPMSSWRRCAGRWTGSADGDCWMYLDRFDLA